ncbi:MAG: bifunctional proline dehydrogenase/L-glutamate gamma-semialdehyde dehydrogenase PutA [Pseudomonadales bacterium]|nr:bifunctional proline dehydrogenase/L-glutamate gamma-semialdehyde dehydrogenase PutA [Pseudomonadales bacterium]
MTAGSPLARARTLLAERKLEDEAINVERLLDTTPLSPAARNRALERARDLVRTARTRRADRSALDAFLEEYGLSNEEGVALMCLAEALLRIPDDETIDELIADKIPSGKWSEHLGGSDALFVNASTWALLLTGRVIDPEEALGRDPSRWLRRLVSRVGEPVIRRSVLTAMRILGREFVLGEHIDDALARGRKDYRDQALFSFDMLGEGARSAAMAARYLERYAEAIDRVAEASPPGDVRARNGISIKLSALHPRYDLAHFEHSADALYASLRRLARAAAAGGIGLNIDAEEADRLEISMDLFERLVRDPELSDYAGLGFVVQAYGKRATATIEWLDALAAETGRSLMVRLVKGAYWDTEIKHAQVQGLDGFSVFTRKASTDLSYLVCAKMLFDSEGRLYPQFATHNAHTVAAILEMAGDRRDFEFQRLHGMGELLYDVCRGAWNDFPPLRTYAPVGEHEDLLAYLVRRLLENGANSSFVNRFLDDRYPVEEVVTDPVATVRGLDVLPHPLIALPRELYAPRINARALDLTDRGSIAALQAAFAALEGRSFEAGPVVGGRIKDGVEREVRDPARTARLVGRVADAEPALLDAAISSARAAQREWNGRGGEARALVLEAIADAFEDQLERLMYLAVREAGKTLGDALAEVREAVDFCRYYAAQARLHFGEATALPGPTGERNQLRLEGRGVFACISPWNFPLAIFTGQVTGALAAGNAVIAKPAEQTSLIAAEAVKLMHEAGVPGDVLHLLPGDGPTLGAPLVTHPGIDGVVFTGSEDTARAIRRAIVDRPGPMIPLIAETGGLNAMFVDSSALLEQVTDDVIRSAFGSAGQRCSALRVLYLQEDIADRALELIRGAMDALVLGDPMALATDVGPVIDADAQAMLEAHAARMDRDARARHEVRLPEGLGDGHFVAPRLYEVAHLDDIGGEKFGPILHVRRFEEREFEACLEEVSASRFGLTLGIHSRIDRRCRQVATSLPVGNAYVNRNMIGAIVGSQPFGGRGLSGTGPKAGGPHYLLAFATERTITVNTAASGGNPDLLRLIR